MLYDFAHLLNLSAELPLVFELNTHGSLTPLCGMQPWYVPKLVIFHSVCLPSTVETDCARMWGRGLLSFMQLFWHSSFVLTPCFFVLFMGPTFTMCGVGACSFLSVSFFRVLCQSDCCKKRSVSRRPTLTVEFSVPLHKKTAGKMWEKCYKLLFFFVLCGYVTPLVTQPKGLPLRGCWYSLVTAFTAPPPPSSVAGC